MFFEQKDVNFAAYADDNTPFFVWIKPWSTAQ